MTLVWRPGFLWNETAWNPSMIQTVLWLDAADASTVTTISGAVSQWNDKSGNGRNAAQSTAGNQPAYTSSGLNNQNVFTFDGTSDRLTGSSLPSFGDIMVLAVASGNSISASQERIIFAIDNNNDNSGYVTGYWLERESYNNALGIYINGSGQSSASESLPVAGFTAKILCHQRQLSVFSKLFIDGAQSGSTATTGNRVNASTNSNTYYIGRPNFWSGGIAEVIVTTSVLDSTRQKLEGYLAHKWGLTANLPNDHPYKINAPAP